MASEPISVGGMTIQFLLESDETGGAVSMFTCELPGGSEIPVPHSHDAFDETIYCLTGAVAGIVNGELTDLSPGDVLFIPRGAVHSFAVRDGQDSSILCVTTPGGFGPEYFREIAAVVKAAGDGPPDREAMMAVMRRHGLTPALAPAAHQ